MKRTSALLWVGLLSGCNTIYTDLRDAPLVSDSGVHVDSGLDAGNDAAVGDAGEDQALLQGSFEGRTGYIASGTVELVQNGRGLELVFGDDFDSQGVPAPVVILSTREALGTTVDAALGDLELGALQATTGAQRYPVPAGGEAARYAWVYCRPFQVEVARAPLLEVSE